MKTLYLECNMGASGDMLMAALLELHNEPDEFLARLNGAGIPKVTIIAEPSVKCGIAGTHIKVEKNVRTGNAGVGCQIRDEHALEGEEYSYGGYRSLEQLINHLQISDAVRKNALEVHNLLTDAASYVRGIPADQIHFREIGGMNTVANIVGVCMLMEELAPDTVLASPVHLGSGHICRAHGIVPVPAPETAFLLKNVPIYNDTTNGELCTPTGAALLKHFVRDFSPMPVMTVTRLGYGMGKADFEKANCVRAYIGEAGRINDEVTELVCNLDDMTPEAIAFARQLLFDEGALDVYTTPIVMKKGRSGILFTCMCPSAETKKFVSLIFKHTTTLGMREIISRRYTLERNHQVAQTMYGPVGIKVSSGYGVIKSKPEYEDIARIARENGKSIGEVLKETCL